jgi:hypothetical protein
VAVTLRPGLRAFLQGTPTLSGRQIHALFRALDAPPVIGFWLLLALVVWAASVGGVQLLYPHTLIRYLERGDWAWWAGELLVPLAQLGSLALLARMPFERTSLAAGAEQADPPRPWRTAATWLAVVTWWSWLWAGESQWLRCAPREALWCFLVVLGLSVALPIKLRVVSLLAAVGLLPSSLAGCAAALAWTSVGSLRAVAALLAYVGAVGFYRPPGAVELGWAAVGMLLLFLRRGEPQMGALLLFGLFSAALGAPSSATVPAVAAATILGVVQRSRFWQVRPFWATRYPLLLVATILVLIPGVLRLSRGLIAPWRETGVPLAQTLVPHGPQWWTRSIGPRWGFSESDLRAAEWLATQPQGAALVVSADRPREPRWVADLYRHFSGGRAGSGWVGGSYSLEATRVKEQLSGRGTGLRWIVLRGNPDTAVPLPAAEFAAGAVRVLPVPSESLPVVPVLDLKVSERSGPGGIWAVELWASGAVAAGGPPPRLVLEPGLNRLRMPEKQPARVFDMGGRLLSFPPFDLAAQLRQVRVVGGQPVRVPGRTTPQLGLRMRNSSTQPLELSALAGARLVFAGDRSAMPQEMLGNVPAGGETEVVIGLPADAARRGVPAQVWLVDRAGVEYWVGSVAVSGAVRVLPGPAEALPSP